MVGYILLFVYTRAIFIQYICQNPFVFIIVMIFNAGIPFEGGIRALCWKVILSNVFSVNIKTRKNNFYQKSNFIPQTHHSLLLFYFDFISTISKVLM